MSKLHSVLQCYSPTTHLLFKTDVPIILKQLAYFLVELITLLRCPVHLYTYTHTHMHTHAHMHIHTCTHTLTHIYRHTHTQTHTHMHTHTYTRTHAHTRRVYGRGGANGEGVHKIVHRHTHSTHTLEYKLVAHTPYTRQVVIFRHPTRVGAGEQHCILLKSHGPIQS